MLCNIYSILVVHTAFRFKFHRRVLLGVAHTALAHVISLLALSQLYVKMLV